MEEKKGPQIQEDGAVYKDGTPESMDSSRSSEDDVNPEEVDGYCCLCGAPCKDSEAKCKGCEEPLCQKCLGTPTYVIDGSCFECADEDQTPFSND